MRWDEVRTWLLLCAACAGACDVQQHRPGDDDVPKEHPRNPFEEPPVLDDLNPDPDVVEVELVAKPSWVDFGSGSSTRVWTYNGSLPGPTIEAQVGDTLIVHFKNELPEPTTVHWHGLELPADMDGSMIAQEPVAPGGTFRYEFELLRASTYWFHPHIRGHEQVELGLYAPLIVRDPAEDTKLGLPENERVLVLDDVLLDEHGQIAASEPTDPLVRAEMLVNGREGNVLLVNGKQLPYLNLQPGKPVRLRIVNASNSRFQRLSFPGQAYRIGGDLGLLSAPQEIRPIEQVPAPMHGTGHAGCMAMDHGDGGTHGETDAGADAHDTKALAGTQPMGEHGAAMMSDPDPAVGLMLTPGERADVLFIPDGEHGERVFVDWHDFPRGRHTSCYDEEGHVKLAHDMMDGRRPAMPLLGIQLVGNRWPHAYEPPASLRDVVAIDAEGAQPLPVRFGHTPPDDDGNITFFATMKDGMGVPFEQVGSAEALQAKVGETRVWEVMNMTMGDHPFHIHGFAFQLLETRYVDMDDPGNNYVVPAGFVEDKDTIRVPARLGEKGRSMTIARLAVRFDDRGREGRVAASGKVPRDNHSGGWLFHCHILEHSAEGMASFLELSY